jgi:nitrogen fixation/metabolism regulation signal transduction histidine kinase
MTSVESKNNSSMLPPHRRRLRNFLLLKGFQLKYAALFAGTALVLSVLLGSMLAKTSREVLRQSQEAVEQGRRAVETGQQLVQESQKVSAVVGLSLVKTADYSDHPELADAFAADSQSLAAKTQQRQRSLESQSKALAQNASVLSSRQRSVLTTIFGMLALLVVALGIAGIVFTHKVAGPLFKMQRYLVRIREGRFVEPAPLRRGDDLQEFFAELCSAIRALRTRESEELELLEATLAALSDQDAALRERIVARCDLKRRALEP